MEQKNAIQHLHSIIKERKENPSDNSYTCYLFEKGINKILKKVGEECAELIIASKDGNDDDVVNETTDLIYHICVLLVSQGIEFSDVFSEIAKRAEKIGNLKSTHITNKNT